MRPSLRAFLFAGFALCAFGQVQTGRLTGTVFDPNKSVVPNASVTVTSQATNVATRVTTDGQGAYVVLALNPGRYTIAVTAPGFRTMSRPGVEMQVGKDLHLDVDLSIGETSTVLEVRSERSEEHTSELQSQ